MGSINLYKIDNAKLNQCLQELNTSTFEEKHTKTIKKNIENISYQFNVTLYLEIAQQSTKALSWNWILKEFGEQPLNSFKTPKAILIIEKTIDESKTNYAATFGNAFFKIDKFCDRDFGFNFASRMEYRNIKTTTLTAPNLARNKTVNTYINYTDLDFNSGESFSKLKVTAKLAEDFSLFKPTLEIGNSIKLNTDKNSITRVIDIILYIENILQIPDEETKYKIPLFQSVKDEDLLSELNKKMEKTLLNTLVQQENLTLLSLPELEIIGANEIFNHTDDEFEIKYSRTQSKKVNDLSIETLMDFCRENEITSIEEIKKIKIIRYQDGSPIVTLFLNNIIEYTDDENKCVLSKGKWYKFNKDYLTYLNDSISEIEAIYKKDCNFNDEIHTNFIDEKYLEEKSDPQYLDKTKTQIKQALKRKYYAERCFNILREKEGTFLNFDRDETSLGFEKMDLYEKATFTMFAVKKGKSSSDLCYAVDQSLTSLKKLKSGEINDIPPIKNVGLWLILETKSEISTIDDNKINLADLNMLMLKNRIDQWKKEVRLSGYTPIIYISYRH